MPNMILQGVIGTHQGPTSDQSIIDNSPVTHSPHHPQRLLQTGGWILCLQFAHRSPGLRTSLAGPSKRHQNAECWESSNLALLISFLAVAMELSRALFESVLPLQQLGPQCSAQIPELHPTKANQRQVPSNQRAPIRKVPVRNQKPVLRQGLRQSCGTFNSTCSLLLGSPRLSETIRNNIR